MIAVFLVFVLRLTQPVTDTWTVSRTLVLSFESNDTLSQKYVITDVQSAANWWRTLSPVPIHLNVTRVIPPDVSAKDIIPIYISTVSSLSYTDGYSIWIGNDGPYRGAVIAHELGHVLFKLPDWYLQLGMCNSIDIMCEPVSAYTNHVIGCRSLNAILPESCVQSTIFLPWVQQ